MKKLILIDWNAIYKLQLVVEQTYLTVPGTQIGRGVGVGVGVGNGVGVGATQEPEIQVYPE